MPAPGPAERAGLAKRLRAAGVVAAVADDLVARFPAGRIMDALDVLRTRQTTNAAGWLVRAISEGWQLHDEAKRIRTARRRDAQRKADAYAAEQQQQRREQRLAGWAAAVSTTLSDEQLTTVVERVARPVAGIDRYSAPVAYSQILAWAIQSATARPSTTLDAALREALHHADTTPTAVPEDVPAPPGHDDTNARFADELKQRIAQVISVLEPRTPREHAGSG
jgi:hypothetical protein